MGISSTGVHLDTGKTVHGKFLNGNGQGTGVLNESVTQ